MGMIYIRHSQAHASVSGRRPARWNITIQYSLTTSSAPDVRPGEVPICEVLGDDERWSARLRNPPAFNGNGRGVGKGDGGHTGDSQCGLLQGGA